tara:strand:+ start:2832 stop:2987 length:156 start_codon:yes stop_codon:yes gene_type:complete
MWIASGKLSSPAVRSGDAPYVPYLFCGVKRKCGWLAQFGDELTVDLRGDPG